MTPCSSGNSPTMPVTRSALASRAARSAVIRVGALDDRLPRPASAPAWPPARPCRRRCRAFRGRRSRSSFLACSSSGTLRSCSQKKRASLSRAASTRRLPSTIAVAAVIGIDVGDADECRRERRRPSSAQAKYFWLVRIVSTITSRGTSRKSASNRPSSGTGHSVSPAFSTTSPSSSTRVSPAAAAASRAPSRTSASRSSWIDDDMAGAQFLDIVVRAADGDRAGVVEAVAERRRAAPRSRRFRPARCPRRARRRCPCSGRTQRSEEVLVDAAPQRIDLGQGKAPTIRSTASASTALVARPGLSIIAK